MDLENVRFHFYLDNSVIYCTAPIEQQTLGDLRPAFDIIQARFSIMKLVLNVEKIKCI